MRLAKRSLDLIPRGTKVRIIAGPNRGRKWIVGAGNHVCWLGMYEPAQCRALLRHLKPGVVFWDVGAHAGYYTLAAAKAVGGTGEVLAFEPSASNVQHLERHVSINRVPNAHVQAAAVGSTPGTASFHVSGSSYTGRVGGEGALTVRVTTCDLELGKRRPPDVIKIDVEGAELDVLAGAERTLQQARPVLFVSTHSRDVHEHCMRMLRDVKYTCRSLERNVILATPQA